MSKNGGIWNKLSRVVIFLLVVAGVLGLGLWYFPLIKQNERMRNEIHQLRSEVDRLEQEVQRREQTVKLLKTDRDAVERLIRERLGYVLPGETRVQFVPGGNNKASTGLLN